MDNFSPKHVTVRTDEIKTQSVRGYNEFAA